MPHPLQHLESLPRLKGEALTACVGCGRQLLETGFPLFYRFSIQRAGIDPQAINERVGLTTLWGGNRGAAMLAEAFASKDPAIVIDDLGAVNICHACGDRLHVSTLFFCAMERADAKGAQG